MKTYIFFYYDDDYTFEIEAESYDDAFNKAFEEYGPQVNDMFYKLK